MKIEDLRQSSGNYPTREALVAAVLHKSRTTKLSHKKISEEVGVVESTVSRIIKDDAPEYREARRKVEALPSNLLNQYWVIPDHKGTQDEEIDNA